jgi:magnesium chelatase family protein
MASRYQKRISGPLLDRIDIHIEVPRVEATLRVDEKLSDDRLGEPSAAIRKRVEAARTRQAARFAGTRMLSSANLCPGKGGARGGTGLLPAGRCREEPAEGGDAAAPRGYPHERRAYHGKTLCVFLSNSRGIARILKLARTIADLAGSDEIQTAHLAEAMHCSRFSIGREGKPDMPRRKAAPSVASNTAFASVGRGITPSDLEATR